MDVDEFNRLKKKCDDLQRQADRDAGALEQLLERLKKEYNCTLAEAEELLVLLEAESSAAELAYETELTRIKREYGDKLGL